MSALPYPETERFEVETRSAEETKRLAVALTPVLVPGDMLVLAGDLGAGKTVFVQGLAAGLGIPEAVTSPTFVLAREYCGGRYPLMHLDIFRLNKIQEIIDLGYDEFLDPSGIVAIEWGDVVEPLLPREHLHVELYYSGGQSDVRAITLRPRGPHWAERLQTIKVLVANLFYSTRDSEMFAHEYRPDRDPNPGGRN